MNSILFQPFCLHDLTLPNRIVLSPMTRGRAGAARLPNRLMAEYYAQRRSAGLLITEATTISEEANGWSESPGIYTDEMTEGWKYTTNAAHEKGVVGDSGVRAARRQPRGPAGSPAYVDGCGKTGA